MEIFWRFERILLLVRSAMRMAIRGRADKVPATISRIIVIPTGKLGDVVCCTPVLVGLRKHMPSAHIIVAGNSKLHRPLLADSGLADEYLDLEDKKVIEERIKAARADVAIVTGPSFTYTSRLYLAGIPLVIAPTVIGENALDVTRPYKIFQHFVKTYPYRMYEYSPRERLNALFALGITFSDTRKHVGFSKEAEGNVTAVINGIPHMYKYLVGIASGAGNKEKEWGPEKFAAVANYLIEKHNAHIVIIGGRNDTVQTAEIISAIVDPSRVTDTTNVSIDELKAIIARLDIFISVNTGPLYIAEAFDIPTVDILGPVNPWDQSPQGKIHKMVFPPSKPKPLLNIMNTRHHDIEEAKRIAQSTKIEDVIVAAEEALKERDIQREAQKVEK